MRLKIGDFARVGIVSVSALRYYDEVGLMKPVEHVARVDIAPGLDDRADGRQQIEGLSRHA